MGYLRRSALARCLTLRGWSPRTGAAIVAGASLPQQQVWRGTLGDLASDGVQIDGDDPAVIVVGEVAALSLMADEVVDSQIRPESDRAPTVLRR
jgi:siroheme synthase